MAGTPFENAAAQALCRPRRLVGKQFHIYWTPASASQDARASCIGQQVPTTPTFQPRSSSCQACRSRNGRDNSCSPTSRACRHREPLERAHLLRTGSLSYLNTLFPPSPLGLRVPPAYSCMYLCCIPVKLVCQCHSLPELLHCIIFWGHACNNFPYLSSCMHALLLVQVCELLFRVARSLAIVGADT